MASSAKTWIGFFDLLGTRDSAKIKRSDFPTKIRRFNSVLEEQARPIKANTKLRFFSDSAYVECDSANELIQYCRRVRWILFAEEVFFKAAIRDGELSDHVHEYASNKRSPFNVDVKGTSFGPNVVDVYYSQENFKGIGYCVEGAWPKEALSSFVDSCFPGSGTSKNWHLIRDIAFSGKEIGTLVENDEEPNQQTQLAHAFLDNLLSAALRANATKRNLARYYISCLMTAIRSSDFSKIEIHEKKWSNKPVVFAHMFEDKKKRDGYLSISGSECLFLAATNQIFAAIGESSVPKFRDGRFDSICDSVVRLLIKNGLLKSPMPTLPPYIMSHEIAEDISRRLVKLRLS